MPAPGTTSDTFQGCLQHPPSVWGCRLTSPQAKLPQSNLRGFLGILTEGGCQTGCVFICSTEGWRTKDRVTETGAPTLPC